MNSSSAVKRVRWHIFILAIAGGLGFAGYLLVVSFIALSNETRLENIVTVKHPLIEHLREAEESISGFKAQLTNAISLEDVYHIEDAQALAVQFQKHLQDALALTPGEDKDIRSLLNDFNEYEKRAVTVSGLLVKNPDAVYGHQEEVDDFNRTYVTLHQRLTELTDKYLQNYAADLSAAGGAMRSARLWGIGLGLLTIVMLVALAWPISRNARREIERSDRLKDEFLSTISHELRTPLNGIVGAVALLRDTPVSPAQAQLLDAAVSSSSDMLMAVSDILEFSDFLNGNVTIGRRDFTLEDILPDLRRKFGNECQRSGLQFEVSMPDSTWLYTGDADHVVHVLRHLLSNAVKFTKEGVVRLTIDSQVEDSGQARLTCVVRDSGPGVPEHFIADIFKPFQQLDGSYTREFGGLGIGLAICSRIAGALDGSLTFRNHPEGGAEVTFSIPLTAMAAPQVAAIAAPVSRVSEEGKFDPALDVLVVEDNKVNQMVIQGYLKRLGCRAVVANNGQEALDKLDGHSFHLVLMDCQMPVMDGFDATRAIRQMPDAARAGLPIIAVTANAMEDDRRRCFDSGMDDYLAKPIDADSLRHAIEKNLKPLPA